MKSKILISAFAVSLGTPAIADSPFDDELIKDSQLMWACAQEQMDWIGFCNGYLTAVHDSMQREVGNLEQKRFCVPTGLGANALFEAYAEFKAMENKLEPKVSESESGDEEVSGSVLDDPPALVTVSAAFTLFFPCE